LITGIKVATTGVLLRKADKKETGYINLMYLRVELRLFPNIFVVVHPNEAEHCRAELTTNNIPTVSIPWFEKPTKASETVITFPKISNIRAEKIIRAGLAISFIKAIDIRITTAAV